MDLGKYITSILGGPPRDHGPINATQLVIGACMAGYTVTHLPADFLKLFEHPVAQYLVFFILFNTSHGDNTPKMWAFMDALLLTLSVNAVIYIIQNAYKKEEPVEPVPEPETKPEPKQPELNMNDLHAHTHPHPHMH